MTRRSLFPLFLLGAAFAVQASPVCSDSLLGLSDTLTKGERVTWTGTVRKTSATPVCGLPTLPTFPAPASTQLVVAYGATAPMDTSFHGTVLVHSGSTLLVKPGSYRIGAFTVEWGGFVKVDTAGRSRDTAKAGIQMVVAGNIQWMDGFGSVYPGLSDSAAGARISVYVTGSRTVTVGNGCSLRMRLVAPQSAVVLGDQTKVWGAMIARNVWWHNDTWGKFAFAKYNATWDSAKTVVTISGARRFWTNATSIAVAWTVNGVAQTTQTTEALPTEGPHWIKRTSGGSSDSVLAMVDRTAPVVVITSPIDGLVTNKIKLPVTWTVDGVARTDTSTLVEGSFAVTRSVTDSAGNTGSATVHVTLDTHVPVLVFQSPVDGLVTNQPNQTVQWSIDGVAQPASQIVLTEGSNTITKTFTSPAGNTGTKTIHVTLDTHPPVIQILSPTDGTQVNTTPVNVRWSMDGVEQASFSQPLFAGFNTITKSAADAAGNVGSASIKVVLDNVPPNIQILSPADGLHTVAATIAVRWAVDGVEQTSAISPLQMGSNPIVRTATDAAGNVGSAQIVVIRDLAVDTISAGPEPVPPPVNPLIPPTFAERVAFLYSGQNAIQTGVDSGSLPERTLAVVRGKVLTRDGLPLPGVHVSVLDHDEWGETRTRADGSYDLVVNAVGPITLDFVRDHFLPAQRNISTASNDFAIAPTVRLVAFDPSSQVITFGNTSTQAMVGSTTTDQDGSRTPFLVVPAGTQTWAIDWLRQVCGCRS